MCLERPAGGAALRPNGIFDEALDVDVIFDKLSGVTITAKPQPQPELET